jgi:hypothetical protein
LLGDLYTYRQSSIHTGAWGTFSSFQPLGEKNQL